MKRRALLKAGVGALAAGLPSMALAAPRRPVRVLCWSEGTAPVSVYPKEIAGAVADALRPVAQFEVRTASLADADQGLADAALDATDALFWWGHQRHGQDVIGASDRDFNIGGHPGPDPFIDILEEDPRGAHLGQLLGRLEERLVPAAPVEQARFELLA